MDLIRPVGRFCASAGQHSRPKVTNMTISFWKSISQFLLMMSAAPSDRSHSIPKYLNDENAFPFLVQWQDQLIGWKNTCANAFVSNLSEDWKNKIVMLLIIVYSEKGGWNRCSPIKTFSHSLFLSHHVPNLSSRDYLRAVSWTATVKFLKQ